MTFAFNQASLSWKFPVLLIICAGSAGASLNTFTKKSRNQNSLAQKIVATAGAFIGIAGLIWGIAWAFDTGFKPDPY